MKIHNFEQGSEEWFEIRKLKMTASHGQEVGNCGKGLETYILELVSEYLSSAKKEHFISEDTERGNELEANARSLYELENGYQVEEVGFVEIDENVGCSPDGLIADDGGIEIKCPNDINFTKVLLFGEKAIDSKYIWQIQMNLLLTKRKWWDLVYYNPNFKTNLIKYRIEPDLEKFQALEKGLEIGKKLIKEYLEKIK